MLKSLNVQQTREKLEIGMIKCPKIKDNSIDLSKFEIYIDQFKRKLDD